MIDYYKLKLAIELADKYSKEVKIAHRISILQFAYEKPVNYCFHMWSANAYEQYNNIDDLITHLQELTQSKPKYTIGQSVWHINIDDNLVMFQVGKIDRDEISEGWLYENDETTLVQWWLESQLYPTREALLDAQIEYWSSLKNPKESEHIMDAFRYLRPEIKGEIVCNAFNCNDDAGCEWDGILISRNPNRGQCKHCGQEHWIALKDDALSTRSDDMSKPSTDFSYYHCGTCKEDVCFEMDCPCCATGDIQSNQSQVDIDECQHEPYISMPMIGFDGNLYKCLKCGEFYR